MSKKVMKKIAKMLASVPVVKRAKLIAKLNDYYNPTGVLRAKKLINGIQEIRCELAETKVEIASAIKQKEFQIKKLTDGIEDDNWMMKNCDSLLSHYPTV